MPPEACQSHPSMTTRSKLSTVIRRIEQIQEVVLFCLEQPEIRSWLDYFDDSAEEVAADSDDGVRIASAADDRDVVR